MSVLDGMQLLLELPKKEKIIMKEKSLKESDRNPAEVELHQMRAYERVALDYDFLWPPFPHLQTQRSSSQVLCRGPQSPRLQMVLQWTWEGKSDLMHTASFLASNKAAPPFPM